MSETETRERCGYAVTDDEGIEQPCDRLATGWRWYQDCGHEDCLLPACDWHANYGGDRMHAAEAELSRLRGVVEAVQALADAAEVVTGPFGPPTRMVHAAALALATVDGAPLYGRDLESVAKASLAARPVLSREAIRVTLDGHWPTRFTVPRRIECSCGWTRPAEHDGKVAAQILDHLADVLTAGGEQK